MGCEKGCILIADDEVDIRELLGDYLNGQGYDCLLAADAFEALELLRDHPEVDMLMSDIRMPGKSGLELLQEVKRQDEDRVVVMISAVKDIASAISAMSLGAYDYVAKPFKLTEVGAVALRAMERRHLLLENKAYQRDLERKVQEQTKELRQALHELDDTYRFTLQALVTALDTRDEETQGHSLRVVRYTMALARLMEIRDPQLLKIIEYGALLHDIGKIGIPDAILRKPTQLGDEEWAVMKSHSQLGYRVLKRIKFLEESAQMVLHHHERWDGKGYPDGLAGEDIPRGARIFAVADTLDAMTSDRVYRRALPFVTAADEIQRCSGVQFDPAVVRAFLSVPLTFWKEERVRVEALIAGDMEEFDL